MADEFFTRTPPPAPAAAPAKRSGKGLILAILVAFLLGGGGVGYLAWSGLLPLLKPAPERAFVQLGAPSESGGNRRAQANQDSATQAATIKQGALEVRIAALEQRLAQVDLRTEAASGNSARAEGLLIAYATRRALDRGVPLGFLEDQLRLRFADAQPHAVATLINAGRKPVTLNQLVAGLDTLAPSLSATPAAELGTWDRISNEFANLFIIRHDTSPSPAPANRLDRARLALEAGRIEDAVTEVQRLPGAADAGGWIADARRYAAARDALDLIETTALLDTRALRDSMGRKVEQPSPAGPTTATHN